MPIRNEVRNMAEVKAELLKSYEYHLDEIFAAETFNLTFDEREHLIDRKLKSEGCKVIERHIKEDPDGSAKNKDHPEETSLCSCGTEAILSRDKEGHPRLFKRKIQTKNGLVTTEEYGYYCSKERKIFFPSQKKT